jgi:hypothetical protein
MTSVFQSITNYEGDEVNLGDGDGDDDGAGGDVDGDASPYAKVGVVLTMTLISPSLEAPVLQALPSLGVGEDFCLYRRLCKSRENYSVGFLACRRYYQKEGSTRCLRCKWA